MDRQKEFEREFNRILADESITKENRETIRKFISEESARGVKKTTLNTKVWSASVIGKLLKKSFEDCQKEDIIELLNEIDKKYNESTKTQLRAKIRYFWKWLKKDDEFPKMVKWIKVSKYRKMPTELMTTEEIEKMAEASGNIRDKALILCLYESGCRVGEILSLRLKNIMFDDYGFVLLVDGKTGQRRVRIIKYAKNMREWLNIHPHKTDNDSFLWCGLTCNSSTVLDAKSVWAYLNHIGKRIGITKRCNPHSLRHSRATELSNFMTEAQMKAYFGWTQDSAMASVYIHLSGKDIDKDLMKSYGIVNNEKVDLKPVENLFRERIPDDLMYEFLKVIAEENPGIKQRFRDIVALRGVGEVFR